MSITVTQYKAELKLVQNKEQETQKTLDLYIYDEVTDWGSWDWENDTYKESETSANYFKKVLSENEDVDCINIYINSVGGSVYEGLGIYNQLKRHKAYKTVYVDGFACSIASVIAMAGDKVVMPKTSMLMIHNAWTYAAGNAKELRIIADDLDIMSNTIAQAYMEKSNGKLTEEKLHEMLDAETYINAEDCLTYGLCDVIGEDESEKKAKAAVKNSMRTALMRAQLASSAKNLVPETEETPDQEQEKESAEIPEEQEKAEEPKETKDEKSVVDTFMNLFMRKAV